MVEVNIIYQGQLHCEATHGPSGAVIQTDAPRDNMGRGESFSPTDLVATALGSCMLTVMGIAARTLGIDIEGVKISVSKEMHPAPNRKISRLSVVMDFPMQLSDDNRRKLEHAALSCPVHKSLSPDIDIPIKFNYTN